MTFLAYLCIWLLAGAVVVASVDHFDEGNNDVGPIWTYLLTAIWPLVVWIVIKKCIQDIRCKKKNSNDGNSAK